MANEPRRRKATPADIAAVGPSLAEAKAKPKPKPKRKRKAADEDDEPEPPKEPLELPAVNNTRRAQLMMAVSLLGMSGMGKPLIIASTTAGTLGGEYLQGLSTAAQAAVATVLLLLAVWAVRPRVSSLGGLFVLATYSTWCWQLPM